uniref:Mechanosensitive ion channel protein n=1 Tax=Kalanchoe fedtschenkoi TaxID=63787 RepID=A0A7N0V7T4_KALFE
MDFSLRKSFKNHVRRASAGGTTDFSHEELPILSDHHTMSPVDSPDRREVIVKVDGEGTSNPNSRDARHVMHVGEPESRLWRDSSYDFWRDADDGDGEFRFRQDGLPPKLIGHFLNNRGGDMELDLEMNGIRDPGLTPIAGSPVTYRTPAANSKDLKVSFQAPAATKEIVEDKPSSSSSSSSHEGSTAHGYRNTMQNGSGGNAEVLRCTSNASFQKRPSLMRIKTKSRLQDPPPEQTDNKRSGRIPKSGQLRSGQLRSGQLRSGVSSKVTEDEDDDPFMEEDLPDDFKKEKLNAIAIIEWVSLLLIGGALICSLAIPLLRQRSLWQLKLWKWEVLVLVLICGRLVSGWGIRIIVFFIERNFLLRKRVLYFVYGLRKAVRNCLWLGQVLVAWHLLFDKKVERETNSKALRYVTKILVCFLVGSVLWLVKTLMVKVLASSFHVSTYFERIQESLFNQYVIETLSGPPLVEMQMVEEEEEKTMAEFQRMQNAGIRIPPDLKASAFPPAGKSGRVIGNGGLEKACRAKSIKFSRVMTKKADDGITVDHLQKLNHKNISAWNMKRLMNIARRGVLSTLDERILDTTQEDEKAMQIRSEVEAKSAARQIFRNVARPGCKYIYLEDLMRFMPEDEALRTLSLFEGAHERMKISKSCLKNWVVSAFRERRALALTLNDTKTAVNKLHQMVNVIVSIMIAIIWLIILGIASSKFFLVVSSQLVVAAFIFGNTLKTIFEAIIFLFVIHPFDVGDRCEIEGVQMVVEEMNILTTVFLRYDNLKILYQNSVLATKAIQNFFRSPDMGDSVEFLVHIATPVEKIALMKQRITSYIESKSEHWNPSPTVILKDIDGLTRLKFAVWLSHRMNHQDMGEKWIRRAQLVEEMVKVFRELDIHYRLYPIEINVCNMPMTNSARVPPDWVPSAS